MINDYFNKPLYPENNEQKAETQNQNEFQGNAFGNLSSMLSGLSQGGGNSLLSLLLGMKGGGGNLLSKLGENNPFMQMFSSMQNQTKKKESDGSLKKIPEDDFLS